MLLAQWLGHLSGRQVWGAGTPVLYTPTASRVPLATIATSPLTRTEVMA